jgi:hypothetical protein
MSDLDTATPQEDEMRDCDLRLAHQRAFERIRSAGSQPEYRSIVAEAVAELVAACEAYTYARAHAEGRPA